MNWKQARDNADMTMDDVLVAWRNATIPDSIKKKFSRSKLARFENGATDALSVVQCAYLAGIYEIPLKKIDPRAAKECELVLAGIPGLGKTSSTCLTADIAADIAA